MNLRKFAEGRFKFFDFCLAVYHLCGQGLNLFLEVVDVWGLSWGRLSLQTKLNDCVF